MVTFVRSAIEKVRCMFRKVLVFIPAAIVFIVMMLPLVVVFSSFWDILLGGLASLFVVFLLLGLYIGQIKAFIRNRQNR